MWNSIDRMVKVVSDVTVGTVIVLVHVVLADRQSTRALRAGARVPHYEPRLPS